MNVELIEFEAPDGVKLNGYINKKTKNKKVLIQIHGMTSNCFKKREMVISKTVKKTNIDTICINTRGSDIVKYIKYKNGEKKLAGTAYEDVDESYYDIIGTIKYAISLGYTTIYLQGHSLGATKVVYSYIRMIQNKDIEVKNIKAIILLSLVDLPDLFKRYFPLEFIEYANKKELEGKLLDLMPKEAFIHPISVKNYLKYTKYNEEINFAQYSNEDYDFTELNSIQIPIFMRWGNNNEFIYRTANDQVDFMKRAIKNPYVDISFINGADHSYNNKEKELANQITKFLNSIE